jgi:ATP synthase protein I
MPMTEGDSPSKRKDFAERLQALRSEVKQDQGEVGNGRAAPQSAAGWVFRLSVELAAGLLVGGVIGWGLDYWLGTNPLMLILFFLLGATAGIYNVIRAAMQLNREAQDGHQK